MRSLLAIFVIATLGACDFAASEASDVSGDDAGQEPVFAECVTEADCVLASSACCGCAEFAMPDRGWLDGCEDVMCPEPDDTASGCPDVAAACLDGICTVACVPTACELSCEGGFAADAAGCLTCDCAGGAVAPECAIDSDCVEVPADCCGCARGGADTAVPASEADSAVDRLDCPSNPTDAACPEVDVCDPSLAPRCVSGHCQLGESGPPTDSNALCGRPDLPPCPDGTVCVLNADPDASMDGVGTCQAP